LLVVALARVGQRNLPGGAVQQRDAAIAFELAHLLAHGRGAHAQGTRGGAHGAVLHHGGENGHAFVVIHGLYCEAALQGLGKNCRLPHVL
jgi:hypothetical protein